MYTYIYIQILYMYAYIYVHTHTQLPTPPSHLELLGSLRFVGVRVNPRCTALYLQAPALLVTIINLLHGAMEHLPIHNEPSTAVHTYPCRVKG